MVSAVPASAMPVAITREVSPRFDECERTCIARVPIDVGIARSQHGAYVRALRALGCEVIELPAEPDLPDSVFVEDIALVLPEAAVITRPGADSRKPERDSVASALAPYRPLLHIVAPARLDGGDVLVLGRMLYVGLSTRSGPAAIAQLNDLLGGFGYTAVGVEVRGCLHLKSAVTALGDDALLVNPDRVDVSRFEGFECIEVDPAEPDAANCLPVGGSVICSAAYPRTREKLERLGYRVVAIALDELAKAEGAVTCCSLLIPGDPPGGK